MQIIPSNKTKNGKCSPQKIAYTKVSTSKFIVIKIKNKEKSLFLFGMTKHGPKQMIIDKT